MKLTIKQQDLKNGLSIVNHAISSKSTMPILSNVELETSLGQLKLSATNLEIGISTTIDADIEEQGVTVIPAKTLTDLINSLRSGDIVLETGESQYDIRVKAAGSNANIKAQGFDPDEFPQIPLAISEEGPIVLEASLLKEMISQVAFAAADDDARPVLTGVLTEIQDGVLSMSAADAFRLTLQKAPLQGVTQEIKDLIIPAKTLNELARILPSEGSVQMFVLPNRSQVLFHAEQIDLVSRLIEGIFPNIKAAIPKEHETRAVVETKEFAAAVKSVTPFARDSSNIVKVTINSDGAYLVLKSTAEDVGSNETTINAAVEGPDQEIIFNVRYLSEVLAVLDTPEVALEVINAARPGVIRPVSSADFTYIIMPMSTNR